MNLTYRPDAYFISRATGMLFAVSTFQDVESDQNFEVDFTSPNTIFHREDGAIFLRSLLDQHQIKVERVLPVVPEAGDTILITKAEAVRLGYPVAGTHKIKGVDRGEPYFDMHHILQLLTFDRYSLEPGDNYHVLCSQGAERISADDRYTTPSLFNYSLVPIEKVGAVYDRMNELIEAQASRVKQMVNAFTEANSILDEIVYKEVPSEGIFVADLEAFPAKMWCLLQSGKAGIKIGGSCGEVAEHSCPDESKEVTVTLSVDSAPVSDALYDASEKLTRQRQIIENLRAELAGAREEVEALRSSSNELTIANAEKHNRLVLQTATIGEQLTQIEKLNADKVALVERLAKLAPVWGAVAFELGAVVEQLRN